MANPFAALPLHIISSIGNFITGESLGMLRLCSNATRDAFTPYFVRHHIGDSPSVDLTKEGLERLRYLSSSPDLGPRTRHLHLICIYYHEGPADGDFHPDTTFPHELVFPRRELHFLYPLQLLDTPQDKKWMDDRQAEQFALPGAAICEQLSEALRSFGVLKAITLEAVVVLGRKPEHRWPPHKVEHLPWKELWARAIQAYRVVMSAIARSQIHLGRLSIYQETKICSIPYNEAAAVVPRIAREGFAVVGSRFEDFSISLATSVIPVVPIGDDDDDFYELPDISGGQKISASSSEPGARPDFQDIPQLIQLMPNLKSLTMHLYHTSRNDKIFLNSYSPLLFDIFRSTALPQLRLLDLRGFPAQMTIINHILSRYPDIQSLRLQHMYFKSNEWSQAMSPLAKIDSPVSSLYLSDIWAVCPQEGLITNIVHAITNNLVAADPELIYLASNEEQRAEVTREVRLWIELSPKLSPPSEGGMASYGDMIRHANRVLECGPPTNYG